MEYESMVDGAGAAPGSVTSEPGMGETPTADTAAEAREVVYAEDILQEMEEKDEQEDENTVPDYAQANAAPTGERMYTRQEYDDAVRRKVDLASRDMQRRMDADPFYRLGREMAQLAAGQNDAGFEPKGEEMASVRTPVSAEVERSAANMQLTTAARREVEGNPAIARIGKELFQCMLDGEVPKGMRVEEYVAQYPQFLSDCAKFGTKAALRTVKAIQQQRGRQEGDLRKAMRNRSLPRATRPKFNERHGGQVDYMNMSSKQFQKVTEEIKNRYKAGKKVVL